MILRYADDMVQDDKVTVEKEITLSRASTFDSLKHLLLEPEKLARVYHAVLVH